MKQAIKGNSADLFSDILNNLRASNNLSGILPSAFFLANNIGDIALVKWIQLETDGYFRTNPALTEEVVVPEYRTIPGLYYDYRGSPLIITDPKLCFVNEYRLRHGVLELERFSEHGEFISIQDPGFIEIIKNKLKVDVFSFRFSPDSILGVLAAIRTNLMSKLLSLKRDVELIGHIDNKSDSKTINKNITNLHLSVIKLAGKLFSDGHYRQAILDTYILLIERVKSLSGQHSLDGIPLMEKVFSPKRPIIKISDDQDEQLGFMWLFKGAVMGIRNPKAHKLIKQDNPQKALEWLSFASVLFRILDEAEVSESN